MLGQSHRVGQLDAVLPVVAAASHVLVAHTHMQESAQHRGAHSVAAV